MDDWLEVLRSLMPPVPVIGLVLWVLSGIAAKAMSRRARRDQTPSGASSTPRSEGVAQHGGSEQEPLADDRPIVPR